MTKTTKQVRHLVPGDVLPTALQSGPLRVTGLEIHERSPNGATHAHVYRIAAVWTGTGTEWDGKPIAGLVAVGNTEVEVTKP